MSQSYIAKNASNRIMQQSQSEELILKRTFTFNGLLFPQTSYAPLKRMFDRLHDSDNHAITLKQSPDP